MAHVFQHAVGGPAGAHAATGFAGRLRHALRAACHELAGAWRYAVARREFEALDESTLRDIGMSRSEFESYWAESHGLAEPTRQRVVRPLKGRHGL